LPHSFCRSLAANVMIDVRKVTTKKERSDAWVYNTGLGWEFHGPAGFYHYGDAHCAYDARSDGWEAWLRCFNHINAEGTVS
jgi:hypothetical protein